MNDLSTELVQVTAVGMAMVEDLYAEPILPTHIVEAAPWVAMRKAIEIVVDERIRQNQKWGEQHHAPEEWFAILLEEVGELAHEIIKDLPRPKDTHERHMMYMLRALDTWGSHAKAWMHNHEWPKRQQQVFDKEKGTSHEK